METAMALTSAVILAACLVAIIFLLRNPSGSRAGDYAQGVGCAIAIAWTLVGIGAMLGVGVFFHIRWIVKGIFVMTAYPAGVAVPFLVYELWKDRRKKE